MSQSITVPLFPLRLVVFPETTVSLRIFEPRYLDMVKECSLKGTGFGICLNLRDSQADQSEYMMTSAVGTLVSITDFFNTHDNLLGLTVTGTQRFHVDKTRIRDNGLLMGDVTILPEPEAIPLQPEHALLGTLFERIIEQHGGPYANASPDQINNSCWLGYRLCELLPISDEDRQRILACDDAYIRMDMLLSLIGAMQSEEE